MNGKHHIQHGVAEQAERRDKGKNDNMCSGVGNGKIFAQDAPFSFILQLNKTACVGRTNVSRMAASWQRTFSPQR
jgi:hypothetical protein